MSTKSTNAYTSSSGYGRHVEKWQLRLFMAGLAMLGDIFPTAWTGKTLLVMWMGYCGQTETEEKMPHSLSY